jgi:hypothetical protein
MQCTVHAVRTTPGGMLIAHVQVAQYFGDVPAEDGVKPGRADLRNRLRVKAGRLESVLRVYPEEKQ